MLNFLNDPKVIKLLDLYADDNIKSEDFSFNKTKSKKFEKIEERFSFTKRKANVNFSLNLMKLKNELNASNNVKEILKEENKLSESKKNELILKSQIEEQRLNFQENLKKKKLEKVNNNKII